MITLVIDTSGGANFENYNLRNVASLHVGGSALASGAVLQVTGTLRASDIRFDRALVALGGGSAPTLGTIGGSGPATAAQNSWLQVIDSTGANCWIPVWK